MSTTKCALLLRILTTGFLIVHSHPLASFPVRFQPGRTLRYIYDTEITLNEPGSSQKTPAKKDVGFRFSAEVEVTPVWSNNINLLKLLVVGPRIHSVSRPDLSRELKTLPRLPVYFQWEAGQVGQVFAGDDDTVLAINIKKGIISLFQMRTEDGIHSEIDASGECRVIYKKLHDGTVVTKSKTSCNSMDTVGQYSQVNELLGVNLTSSIDIQFTLSEDMIKSVVANERQRIQLHLDELLASIITVKQSLELKETVSSDPIYADSFDDVIKKLDTERSHRLLKSSLVTFFEPKECTVGCTPVTDLLVKYRIQLYPQNTGKTAGAKAFRDVVRAMRHLSKDAIANILNDKEYKDLTLPLIDILSMAQTPSAQAALMEFLNFDESYKIENVERYLLATALSTHPPEQVLRDLLGLFRRSVQNEKLRQSIAQALGAVTNTFFRTKGQEHHKIVAEVLAAFLKQLDKCEDSSCLLTVIHSLGNAGLPETVDVLMKRAELSKDSTVSEAALRALRRIDKKFITTDVRDRLKAIFHQKRRGYDTPVRSQALSFILDRDLTLDEVREIIVESRDPWNTDYDMYIQSRLFDLMRHDEKLREMVKKVLSDPDLANYHVLAPKGKSLAFTSNFSEDPAVAYIMYVENGRSGVLKRSGMDINVLSTVQKLPVYSFGMFAAGLEGLIGDEVDEEDAETVATAGVSLDMVGVSLRPITFFKGKGELMSAVWNAPSELMSVLQTNFLLQDHSERIHLQNGLIAELDVQGLASLDMSAKLSVSLWNKNSLSLVRNRGAVFLTSALSVSSSSFRMGIESTTNLESFLNFQTDVDFYDELKMCQQMNRPDFYLRRNVTKFETARGFPRTFVSKISRQKHFNAESFPLPDRNSENCRILKP